MREDARIASAIDLLARIEAAKIPMDNTIRDFMAQRRFIGSKDRTSIVERIYRIMRSRARLSWWVEQAGETVRARSFVIADLVLNEGLSGEEIDLLFTGGKYGAPGIENDDVTLINFLIDKTLDDPSMPDAVACECPPWAEERLKALFQDDFTAQMTAMIAPAPLDLRVNTVKGTVEDARDSLQEDGIEAAPTPYSPLGLRTVGKPFMSDSRAYRSGLVEIQDEGSQLIGLISGARPGMRVLDFCAGGGGKTLVLAAMMENKGNIVAMDNDARRLEKGKPRYRKAGVHNVEARCLADEQNRKWLRRQKGAMDVVLVDAPCSSSGTWRRNPDLRWKWYGPSLDDIIALQREILDRVADKVKPGGRLIYATCSVFPEENEYQVAAFLDKYPDYDIMPVDKAHLAKALPATGEGFMRLYPKDHGTDGFFAAVLTRKA